MVQEKEQKPDEPADGKPPLFKSWKGMYWLVGMSLAVTLAIFYWITQHFS